MGLFSTIGDVALSILGGIAGQAAGNLDRQSRRRGLSEEQRKKFRQASRDARNVSEFAEKNKGSRKES